MASGSKSTVELVATSVQVLSVLVGVVISVLSFNSAREKEAEARKLEAMKPLLVLRQELYTKVVKAAATLANPKIHSKEELDASRKTFRDLYVAELSMVESREVEKSMVAFATVVDPELVEMTPAQNAAYSLAHALRDTFVASWSGVSK